MKKTVVLACLFLGGGGAPPHLWAQQVPAARPFVAAVEVATNRWSELFRVEDTAQLTPLDLRHFHAQHEVRKITRVWDGTQWMEVVDRIASDRPEEGMPFPVQTVRNASGVQFYYADSTKNHALTWTADDAAEWRSRAELLVPRLGGWAVDHPPFPDALQIRNWGKSVVENRNGRLTVVLDGRTVVYDGATGLRTERWGTNDSVRRTQYRSNADGTWSLAELEESGRQTGAQGACWRSYRTAHWGLPAVDTGAVAVQQWLAERGWSTGINGPYAAAMKRKGTTESEVVAGDSSEEGNGRRPAGGSAEAWVASGNSGVELRVPSAQMGVPAEISVLDESGQTIWRESTRWSGGCRLPEVLTAGLYTVRLEQMGAVYSTRWMVLSH